jgi:hypothetical protein
MMLLTDSDTRKPAFTKSVMALFPMLLGNQGCFSPQNTRRVGRRPCIAAALRASKGGRGGLYQSALTGLGGAIGWTGGAASVKTAGAHWTERMREGVDCAEASLESLGSTT